MLGTYRRSDFTFSTEYQSGVGLPRHALQALLSTGLIYTLPIVTRRGDFVYQECMKVIHHYLDFRIQAKRNNYVSLAQPSM